MQIHECTPLLRSMGAKIGTTNEAAWQELLNTFALEGLRSGIARAKVATREQQVAAEQVAEQLGHKLGGDARPKRLRQEPLKQPPMTTVVRVIEATPAIRNTAIVKPISAFLPHASDAVNEASRLLNQARVKIEIALALIQPNAAATHKTEPEATEDHAPKEQKELRLVTLLRDRGWQRICDVERMGISTPAIYTTLKKHSRLFEKEVQRGKSCIRLAAAAS